MDVIFPLDKVNRLSRQMFNLETTLPLSIHIICTLKQIPLEHFYRKHSAIKLDDVTLELHMGHNMTICLSTSFIFYLIVIKKNRSLHVYMAMPINISSALISVSLTK